MSLLESISQDIKDNPDKVWTYEDISFEIGGKERTFRVRKRSQEVKNGIITYLAKGRANAMKDPFKFDFMVIQAYVFDLEDNPLVPELTTENREKLTVFPPDILEKLQRTAMKLNGFTKEDQSELENF